MARLPDGEQAVSYREGAMSLRPPVLSIPTAVLLATFSLFAQKARTATEAKDHIGQQVTIWGKVVSPPLQRAVTEGRKADLSDFD